MKRILLFFICLLILNQTVFANETPINVIYIHGSNQVNFGGTEAFSAWINKMHPYLKKNFEKSDFIQQHLLQNAYIKDDPDMFYWGDMVKNNKSLVDAGLEKSKPLSTKITQFMRSLIGQLVHDAVWLQKKQNMTPVLDKLNARVIANYSKGEKTMFVGYSAGTFITLQYLLARTPVINLKNLFERFKGQYNITDYDVWLASKYAQQNTCASALIKSNLITVDDEGILSLNSNSAQRKTALTKIKQQTQLICAPEGAISGVLNFASPIVVFYSELSDANLLSKYIIAKTSQNIVETNKFYLTMNYSKDPVAIPAPDFTFSRLTKSENCKGIQKGEGFIYDSIVKGGKFTAEGHVQYWHTPNHYTKAVAKAFEDGYKYFYEK